MRALYDVSHMVTQSNQSTDLMPSLRLLVTLSPKMLVSTLNLDTMSPAERSANSGSCLSVAR
jgi:hypothetical protein